MIDFINYYLTKGIPRDFLDVQCKFYDNYVVIECHSTMVMHF